MEAPLLRAAFFSDTHIRAAAYRRAILLPGLIDVSRRVKPDLFVVAGDCTDTGSEENWAAFQKTLARGLRVPNVLLALGNHDTWESYEGAHDYTPAHDRFLRYANAVTGFDAREVYYAREINGIPFLVLGSDGTGVSMDVSDAQFSWLRAALEGAVAARPESPVFVISHSPLHFTHGIGDGAHGSGFRNRTTSSRLREILDCGADVFLFSGHVHRGLQASTVERVGERLVSVNLPCYEYGGLGSKAFAPIGEGLVADVFPDGVRLRGRNFLLGVWSKKVDLFVRFKR